MKIRTSLRIFLLLAPVVSILMIFVEIVITNRLATLGHELVQIEEQIRTVKGENQLLAQKIASASSLAIIGEQSKSRGFIPPEDVVSLSPEELPFALNVNEH